MLILFFRILFCHHNQITAISSQHPITGQRNASCLISNIIGTYWVQARTVWIQIRLQFFCQNSEYDQKIPQSQTEDKPMAQRGRATQPSRNTRKTTKQSNQLSLQIQIVLTFQAFIRPSVYSQIDHLLASFFILRSKNMATYDIHIMESLPGILRNRRNDIYSRRTGNKGQILSGTGYKGNIGEHGT